MDREIIQRSINCLQQIADSLQRQESGAASASTSGNVRSNGGAASASGNERSNGGAASVFGNVRSNGGAASTSGNVRSNGGAASASGNVRSNVGAASVFGNVRSNGGAASVFGNERSNGGAASASGNVRSHGDESSRASVEFARAFPGLHGLQNRVSGRHNRRTSRPYFVPSNNWTQKFFCLGEPSDITTADRAYTSILERHELGFRKICFNDKQGDHEYFIRTLCKHYPPLSTQNGAICLWKCSVGGGSRRPLEKIPPGVNGYDLPYIRSRVQSGFVYITPMQTTLLPSTSDRDPHNNSLISTAKCNICNDHVDLKYFSDHIKDCSAQMLREDRERSRSEVVEPLGLDEEHSSLCDNTKDAEKVGKQSKSMYITAGEPSSVATLKTLFPDRSDSDIMQAHKQSIDLNESIDKLLSDSGGSDVKINDLLELYKHLREKYLAGNPELILKINREELWRELLVFYKKSFSDKQRLFNDISIQFTESSGEEGAVDAGALKREFFNIALDIFAERLFEGDEEKGLIPKKLGSSGNSTNYKVAGIVVGHSFLQSTVVFARLPDCIYSFLIDPNDIDLLKLQVSEDLIPLNAATTSFLDCIKKLRSVKDEEELGALLNDCKVMEHINSSQWGITETINLQRKDSLILELLYNEIFRKRIQQLQAFRSGLEYVGLLSFITKFPKICKDVIVNHKSEDPTTFFCKLLQVELEKLRRNDENVEKCNAVQWTIDYLKEFPEYGGCLLQFVSSRKRIPQWGIGNFRLMFLPDDEENVLPKASACFNHLLLPVVHSNKQSFYKYMDIALQCESTGFSINED